MHRIWSSIRLVVPMHTAKPHDCVGTNITLRVYNELKGRVPSLGMDWFVPDLTLDS
jgi:hypothetical protein